MMSVLIRLEKKSLYQYIIEVSNQWIYEGLMSNNNCNQSYQPRRLIASFIYDLNSSWRVVYLMILDCNSYLL